MNLNFHISRRLLNIYTRFSMYVIIGVVIILVLAAYLLLIGPKWTDISSVGLNDYQREQNSLDADKQYLEALKTLVAKYNSISQSRIDEITQIVPTGDQIPALFVQIEAMVQDAGMTLQDVKFETATDATQTTAGNLQTLNINMQVKGGNQYADMKQLLDIIEKNQRLLDLVSVNFTLNNADIVSAEGANDGSYQLLLRTYYLNESKATTVGSSSDINDILQQIQTQQ